MPITRTSTLKVPYRLEKPVYNSQLAVSFYSDWRRVSLFLHEMKRVNLSIYKARLHESWTTIHMNSQDPTLNALVHKPHLENVLSGRVLIDSEPLYYAGLNPDTKIHIYNIATCPYTVLDLITSDRVGLFCEILEFLTPLDVHIQHANCKTVGTFATNTFFLSDRKNQKLSTEYIEYLSNVFEHDLKRNIDHNAQVY